MIRSPKKHLGPWGSGVLLFFTRFTDLGFFDRSTAATMLERCILTWPDTRVGEMKVVPALVSTPLVEMKVLGAQPRSKHPERFPDLPRRKRRALDSKPLWTRSLRQTPLQALESLASESDHQAGRKATFLRYRSGVERRCGWSSSFP